MAKLPADRTKLSTAQANQQPNIIASSQANREALTEIYDTVDLLNSKVDGLVTSGTLSPLPPDLMSRQAVVNGNFDFAQRGTTFTNPSSNQYTLDRWLTIFGLGGGTLPTLTHTQEKLIPEDIINSYYFYRIATNGAGSGFGASAFYFIAQKIENGVRSLCGTGKKITVSFYARSSIPSKKLGVSLRQDFGTGGTPSLAEDIKGTAFTLTSSWAKCSFTFTTNTLSGKTFGTNNDDNLRLSFWPMWGSNFLNFFNNVSAAETFVGAGNIDIAQIQLCAGETALPFHPRFVGEENDLCRRFLIVMGDNTNTAIPIGEGLAISTTVAHIHVDLGKEMRIPPSLSATAADWALTDGVTTIPLTAISILSNRKSNKTLTLECTVASGLTQFRPYQLVATGANKKMIFDAEQ